MERILSLWTLKEAYAKAVGQGLHLGLQRLEFDLAGQCATTGRVWAQLDGVPLEGWTFTLQPWAQGYLLAVARGQALPHPLVVKVVGLADLTRDALPGNHVMGKQQ